MARRRRPLVPEAGEALDQLKKKVMAREGINVAHLPANKVKYEVAEEMGIPLKEGDNGNLKSAEAGKIGGKMGGSMVREMIKMAQEQLEKDNPPGKQ
ncbi:MAG TPA: alpha/beta hydrolase [Paenibacillaceae bacterium]|nr:alpha/beta hydrolase [Paenibacillaceae bacterium]